MFHRDIKPGTVSDLLLECGSQISIPRGFHGNSNVRTDNVFYHGDFREVVIGDMGLARQLSGDSKYYNSKFGK